MYNMGLLQSSNPYYNISRVIIFTKFLPTNNQQAAYIIYRIRNISSHSLATLVYEDGYQNFHQI